MSEFPPGQELENDLGDNPCFGCGPNNRAGLHLRFFDDGEAVRAPLTLGEPFVGWPGMANMGVVLLAMTEVGGWAVWERLGPSRPTGPMTMQGTGQLPLGTAIIIEVRVRGESAERQVEVRCLREGKEVARAEWPVRALTPEEAAMMLKAARIPRSLRPSFEQRAGAQASTMRV